LRALAGQ